MLDPLSFPPNLTVSILDKAGPHARQVCRAYHDHHPPLLSFAPHGPTTSAALQAALAALPPTTTTLDLRGIPLQSAHAVRPATLAAIAAALPNLQRLLLPVTMPSLIPAILTTLHACPNLYTFHANTLNSHPAWHPHHTPPLAPHLRSLTLPVSALGPLATPSPGALPRLTSLTLHPGSAPLFPHHIANLPAAAPTLRSLALTLTPCDPQHHSTVQLLTALANLRHLKLHRRTEPAPAAAGTLPQCPTGDLLQHVSPLTTLHSLQLDLNNASWTPQQAGWLSRLTQLTSLHLHLALPHDTVHPPENPMLVITGTAASAAKLPLLQRLHLSFTSGCQHQQVACPEEWLSVGGNSLFRHLASATQLRHLALQGLPLPHEDAALLTRLQGLTSLCLHSCTDGSTCNEYGPGVPTLRWVCNLPLLQRFEWVSTLGRRLGSSGGGPAPPFQVAAGAAGLPATGQGNLGPPHAGSEDAGHPGPHDLAPNNDHGLPAHRIAHNTSLLQLQPEAISLCSHSGDLGRSLPQQLTPRWQVLSKLRHLRSLAIQLPEGSLLSGLLAELLVAVRGELTSLQLGEGQGQRLAPGGRSACCQRAQAVWAALHSAPLHVLGQMLRLEVLDLRGMNWALNGERLLQHLRLPGSLRQCYVPGELLQQGAVLLGRLRAAHPHVVFRAHRRFDKGEV